MGGASGELDDDFAKNIAQLINSHCAVIKLFIIAQL